ncbi:MAG: PhzA/PhzB family protein [Oscillospiraceae bacterium]|nr:PhzA/PhzB family protein [Oscillospiraceae bacterium]
MSSFDFPPVERVTVTPQYRVVERFLTTEFWRPEQDDLFAPDIEVELPHAPFGMLQHMIPFEFQALRFWLRETVRSHRLTKAPVIIPTTDPDVFWTIRNVEGDVFWAKREGRFVCEFAARIIVKDGRIQSLRDYGNPISFYDAVGIILPNFNYLMDLNSDVPCVRMGADQVSHFTPEENAKRAIANFADPINGHDDDPEPIYAHNVVMVTPFAPRDMLVDWPPETFDAQTDWMFRSVPEWNVMDPAPFYQSVDPNVIVVESYGYGKTTWSNREGHYIQRELQIVHLDRQGKIDHFRVYFNSLNKFSSMNQHIPSFPYFNF